MGYTFKSLCIRNFKYITNNKPLKFDFMNSNIVILDGQNGYGKTTLFDAIEVLVTGKIKHFNPSLQNRKTETLGTLANDVNKDIVISAILSSDFSDEIHVERKLLCKNEFQSIITLNSQEISQEELYDKFHLSSNMFDIGTYISQSESLDFLQNKYKNRKDSVSSLLDDTEITDKIQMLKSVQVIWIIIARFGISISTMRHVNRQKFQRRLQMMLQQSLLQKKQYFIKTEHGNTIT